MTNQAVRVARIFLEVRRIREAFLPEEIFDEYGWNMLLHLFVAGAENRQLDVPELLRLSGAPPGSGERWIKYLQGQGHVLVSAEGEQITLTKPAECLMQRLLDEASKLLGTDLAS